MSRIIFLTSVALILLLCESFEVNTQGHAQRSSPFAQVSTLSSGPMVDAYTQFPAPFGGQGLNLPSDMFWPQKQIELYANLTNDGVPVQGKNVSFEIRDPQDGLWGIRIALSDMNGVAHTSFTIPWPNPHPEEGFGIWSVLATADLGVAVNDTLKFHFDYLVEIFKTTTDQYQYYHLDDVEVAVKYGTHACQFYPLLLYVVIKDELNVPIGTSFVNTTVGGATFGSYENATQHLYINIPMSAFAGIGKVYVTAYNKLPSQGGVAYSPTYGNGWPVGATIPTIAIQPQRVHWWNTNWKYRKKVEIVEAHDLSFTDFPVTVTFKHEGNVKANGIDIRIIDNYVEIPRYIEECNSTHATVIFETDIPALHTKKMYIYYGNPSASAPSYTPVPLTISEGSTGNATISNLVYIGWKPCKWGWDGDNNEVTLWTDYRIDLNGSGDPRDDNDLIQDVPGRTGGIGRHRVDFENLTVRSFGLGDYQGFVQTPIYVDLNFADAKLRVYKNNLWVETTQADHLEMFTPSFDYAKCAVSPEENIIDGLNCTPDGKNILYNSPASPEWMAFRNSSNGETFASVGLRIGTGYNYSSDAQEGPDWDRRVSFDNFSWPRLLDPYDQPEETEVYWYGGSSSSYEEIAELATLLNNQPTITVTPDTIRVPYHFSTIQAAINHASGGDNVLVAPATYHENVIVNKTLSLIGENMKTTFIDGDETGTPVTITVNGVSISHFTIQNGHYGVRFVSSNESRVEDNILANDYDIFLNSSNHNAICRNSILGGLFHGMLIQNSDSNIVSNNNVTAKNGSAIYLQFSSSNTIANNRILNDHQGICLVETNLTSICGNLIATCQDEGVSIEGMAYNPQGDNTVTNNTIQDNGQGISLGNSEGNTIVLNVIANNSIGFHVWGSGQSRVYYNQVASNEDQAYVNGSDGNSCMWDIGYPSGGNLWSDYDGEDADDDGIGDTPYVIDLENQDSYPLMQPWTPPNIALLSATPHRGIVCRGYPSKIDITVQNQGNKIEGFNITFCANGSPAQTTCFLLASGEPVLFTISGGTTDLIEYQKYALSVCIEPLLNETDLSDNALPSGEMLIVHIGDINGDGKVDIQDLAKVTAAYASVRVGDPKDPRYGQYWHSAACLKCPHTPNADITSDGEVDYQDLARVSSNYGWYRH